MASHVTLFVQILPDARRGNEVSRAATHVHVHSSELVHLYTTLDCS